MSLADLLFGTQLIEILQNLFAPQLNWTFIAITSLGSDAFLAGLSALIYWCFDKRRGRLITYVLFFGAYLNFFLKVLIPWPRPPAEVHIIQADDPSNGFPSGHAQDSTTFWAWISLDFRRGILASLGAVIVIAVGLSRIFLGVHYPAQVIGGWTIGLAVPVIALFVLPRLSTRAYERPRALQLAFAVVILAPLALAPALGVAHEVNAGRIGGYLFGFWLGCLAEARYVRFRVEVPNRRKLFRALTGAAAAGLVLLVSQRVFPETCLAMSLAGSLIQGLTVAAIVPLLFTVLDRIRIIWN